MAGEHGQGKNYTSAKVLVDTNILAYAYDRSVPEKQARAFAVIDQLAVTRRGLLSTQVLAEFFVVVTRKLAQPLEVGAAYERLANYISSWPVVEVTSLVILEAARGVRDHGFSYWDAQIWATARLNQVKVVLSEDFATNSTIEGVTFLNPFLPDFDYGSLGLTGL